MKEKTLIVLACVIAIAGGAFWYFGSRQVAISQDAASVNGVVERFGSQMKNVSLLAPDAGQEISQYYGPYVSGSLLASWQAAPSDAPGRQVSSPWPDRIAVSSTTLQSDGTYHVDGSVVEMTSTGEADEYPVSLTLQNEKGQWVITSFSKQ